MVSTVTPPLTTSRDLSEIPPRLAAQCWMLGPILWRTRIYLLEPPPSCLHVVANPPSTPHRYIVRSNVYCIQPRRHMNLCRQRTQGWVCEICRQVNTAIYSSLHALSTHRSVREWKSGLQDIFCPTDSRNRARPPLAVPSTSHNLRPQSRNHSKLLR